MVQYDDNALILGQAISQIVIPLYVDLQGQSVEWPTERSFSSLWRLVFHRMSASKVERVAEAIQGAEEPVRRKHVLW